MAKRNLWITQWSHDEETGSLTGKGTEAPPDDADPMFWSSSGPLATFEFTVPAEIVWVEPPPVIEQHDE